MQDTVCTHVHLSRGAHGCAKRVLDHGDSVTGDWEHLTWVLEIERGPLKEQHAFSAASKLNS